MLFNRRPTNSLARKWEPFGNLIDLQSQVDRLFDEFIAPLRETDDRSIMTRPGDLGLQVEEGDKHFVLSFDMPGVPKDKINIEVNNRVLTVSGERSTNNQRGSYTKSFTLPEGVNEDAIEASYENGVLSIALPKAAETLQKSRRIEIQDSKGPSFWNKLVGEKKSGESSANPSVSH